jgi:hypothetical protein
MTRGSAGLSEAQAGERCIPVRTGRTEIPGRRCCVGRALGPTDCGGDHRRSCVVLCAGWLPVPA